jgi:hypothetical protein
MRSKVIRLAVLSGCLLAAMIRSNVSMAAFGTWSLVPLRVNATSAPAVIMPTTLNINVFARGTDNAVWWSDGYSLDGVNWNWNSQDTFGGTLLGKPGAASWGTASTSRALIFRGTDTMAHINICDGTTQNPCLWSGWGVIPDGWFNDDLAVIYNFNYLFAFGMGGDGRMYWSRASFPNPQYSTWAPIPNGWFSSAPAATSMGNYVYVTGRGTDNRYYWSRSVDGQSWTTWTAIADTRFATAPAISSWAGHLDIFGTLAGGQVLQVSSNDSGSTWGDPQMVLGTVLVGAPAAISPSAGRVELFGTFGDNGIYMTQQ